MIITLQLEFDSDSTIELKFTNVTDAIKFLENIKEK